MLQYASNKPQILLSIITQRSEIRLLEKTGTQIETNIYVNDHLVKESSPGSMTNGHKRINCYPNVEV